MKKLTRTQRDKLWGEDMPYSEARLIICHRVLADEVTRVFLEVELAINPLTFETVKAHREEFADNQMVQQMLDHSDYRDQAHGYITCAFRHQFLDNTILAQAYEHLGYAQETAIELHKWMMDWLEGRL